MFNVVAQSVLALLEDNRRLRDHLIVSVFFFTEKGLKATSAST